MSELLVLSYPLNDQAYGYGNGDRFKLTQVRDMCCGDTSNNSVFEMPTHYGTHIDFPYHFSSKGKRSTDYDINEFVYSSVGCIEINENEVEEYLIKNKDLQIEGMDQNIELLFVKTGFCDKRYTPEYWEYGFGFHPETASYLKQQLPKLRAIAFDLISLNTYQNRPIGRQAHKEFLIENDILIVEEVDLTRINSQTKFSEVTIVPLMIENADGAPVTIIAKTK